MIQSAMSALITDTNVEAHSVVTETLQLFGNALLTRMAQRGVRICTLAKGEGYGDRSAALRALAIDIDAWATPPAGIFVVAEATVYLRILSPMTIAHELGHALDFALGTDGYISTDHAGIRLAFSQATRWLTPYAASRIDEYFAEAIRAYLEINDESSPWPRVTRERLASIDPAMFQIVTRIFVGDAS